MDTPLSGHSYSSSESPFIQNPAPGDFTPAGRRSSSANANAVYRTETAIKEAWAILSPADRADTKPKLQELQKARQIFMDQRSQLNAMNASDASLWLDVLWGLMVTEQNMSGYRNFDNAGRLGHVKEAENYANQLVHYVTKSGDAGKPILLRLEENILRGQKACLKSKMGETVDTKRAKQEAVRGIDEGLESLRDIDLDRYHKHFAYAQSWRKRF
ncbi:hypothetical protein ACLMJK_002980 [Lecanora helva]